MRAMQPQRKLTMAEYIKLEQTSDVRHEFVEGTAIAMAGGSPAHSLISLNVGAELRSRLKGTSCHAFDSSLRIAIPGRTRLRYADVVVICGPRQTDPHDNLSVTNPKVIVEVLSPPTAAQDRDPKFDDYRLIATLAEYVLVDQDQPYVQTFRRKDDGWLITSQTGLDGTIALDSLSITLSLAEIYAGLAFESERWTDG